MAILLNGEREAGVLIGLRWLNLALERIDEVLFLRRHTTMGKLNTEGCAQSGEPGADS